MIQLQERDVLWEYDGSFWGMMTVVDRAFSQKILPAEILNPATTAISLFPSEWLATDESRGKQIWRRLQQKLTPDNQAFIRDGFNSTLLDKERALLTAIAIALESRDSLTNFIGHPQVLALQKAIQSLLGEVHLLTGFVRFEYVGAILFSKIAPKHQSLPYLCPHFAERYPNEQLLIYDETHRLLAVIDHGATSFIEDLDCPLSPEDANEVQVQEHWQTFLAAVTIKERSNPALQRSHLPLRFRGNMVDFGRGKQQAPPLE